VGSFQPRTLKVEGIEQFEGTQVFYRVKDPALFEGKNMVICGGGDSALDWALNFVGKAESVILLHRREEFRAAPASVAKMKELCEQYEMQLVIGQVTGTEIKDGKLSEVKVTGADGVTRRVPLDMLLVFFGLSPKLGPIAEWGLEIERKQLKVMDTEKFETNVPGIFAVGDINTYPGKKKLILSGFHEAALAAFGAAPYIFPDKKIHMQYTTTSPKLHKVLGVESRSSTKSTSQAPSAAASGLQSPVPRGLFMKVFAETCGARATGLTSKQGVRQSVLCYRVATRKKLTD
jgi:thioredoxin reductase (NADPH)